ncbi:MAG TPA: OB-fold domain-containing protein [Acidimicrobiales bacterium]|nr:OB-fold domain-containing protein [Acidimicrobiales bacterium]
MTPGRIPEDWALPALSPHNEAWYTSGQLALQRCSGCGSTQHPPEEVCRACGGDRFEYVPVRPAGTVHSYTVAHYPVHPALAGSVPYAVVLVSLDDAPETRVVGNMPGTPLEEIRIGLPVAAVWEERKAEDGTLLLMPHWTIRRDA